jgi:hypothetical protein
MICEWLATYALTWTKSVGDNPFAKGLKLGVKIASLWKLSGQNCKFVKIRGVKMQFSQGKIERNSDKL